MRVYIVGRHKDLVRIKFLGMALREIGYEVFDFSDGYTTIKDLPIISKNFNNYGESLSKIKITAVMCSSLLEQANAVKWADIVILLLPCGCDSHTFYGMALGLDKVVYVVGEPEKGDLTITHAFNSCYFTDDAECIDYCRGLAMGISKVKIN